MPNEKRINLNADLGESFGPWRMGDDEAMLAVVGAANLACGFHAGDPDIMRRSVRACRQHGVSIGAHPGYADLQGFGRRPMALPDESIEDLVAYQVGALQALCALEGCELSHVKPHGALSNQACADASIAAAVIRALRSVAPRSLLLAPARSLLAAAGAEAGLGVVEEIYADRAYRDDGRLVARGKPDAMISGAASIAHVLAMLREKALISVSGKRLEAAIGSICVHGDTPGAAELARNLRTALENDGWRLTPPGA